ncbi:YqaA family protein [Pararhodobacter oceanensis]|uniref:YqaA family protein n=1 Tax=Pararhodobacter oceanensis TaxID=2172121 RepID=UPI003A91A6AA
MIAGLVGLFGAAFLAATLIPFNSEVIFVGLQLGGVAPLWLMVVVASVANTLGAFLNYWIGLRLEDRGAHRWMRIPDAQFDRAHHWWERWGIWTLLLSWLPVVELTTVLAGAMRTPFWQFTLLVALAKTGRYVALALITAGLFG